MRSRTAKPTASRTPILKNADAAADTTDPATVTSGGGSARPRASAPPPTGTDATKPKTSSVAPTKKASPPVPAPSPKAVALIEQAVIGCKGSDPYAKYEGFKGLCVSGTWVPTRKGQ